MKFIKKIKLINYRRFEDIEINFNEKMNLLIGENEAGKSSILNAIDLVLSGSRYKVESYGLDRLFNSDVITSFFSEPNKPEYKTLPNLIIEVYLNDTGIEKLNGNANTDGDECDGIKLECRPDEDHSSIINEVLNQPEQNFPFEFYTIRFTTFKNEPYSSYKKPLKHLSIDNSRINGDYAMREYVKDIYGSHTNQVEKNQHANEYRKHKDSFKDNVLGDLNNKVNEFSFAIKSGSKANLETDLTLTDGQVNLEDHGNGRQSVIKTEYALSRSSETLDIVLLEEPENHLSHLNMKKLISKIQESHDKQLFITTHSNLISSRLDLRKSIFLNTNTISPAILNSLSDSTSKFFMKAPDNNILEFVMSQRVVLVEGDAEFILFESFFKKATGVDLSSTDIHVISMGGINYKRYFEVAELLKIRTAVIRDNDGDYEKYCVEANEDYDNTLLQVFSDEDNDRYTFEICVYLDNIIPCHNQFEDRLISNTVPEYMIANKANAAFELLENQETGLVVPDYIKKAIQWISK